MVKIRFLQDRVVQDGLQGTPHETRYAAGQEIDLPAASAEHWLNRLVAERVIQPPAGDLPAPGQGGFDLGQGAGEGADGGGQNAGEGEEGDGQAAGDQSGGEGGAESQVAGTSNSQGKGGKKGEKA